MNGSKKNRRKAGGGSAREIKRRKKRGGKKESRGRNARPRSEIPVTEYPTMHRGRFVAPDAAAGPIVPPSVLSLVLALLKRLSSLSPFTSFSLIGSIHRRWWVQVVFLIYILPLATTDWTENKEKGDTRNTRTRVEGGRANTGKIKLKFKN